MAQDFQSFEQRKKDHVNLALHPKNQAVEYSSLARITLMHDSLPDLNLNDVNIAQTKSFLQTSTPLFVAGMTAGHQDAEKINTILATVASERGWALGVGSQRREFESQKANQEYMDSSIAKLGSRFPKLKIISNIGIAQLIEANNSGKLNILVQMAERIGASVFGVHLNPLQEAIQKEGTPQFKGSFQALESLIKTSPLPVLVKETGSGMSEAVLKKLSSLSLAAVDVSGLGGTHWGRIEGERAEKNSISSALGETFQNWGVSTVESLQNAKNILSQTRAEVWASGGVRTGLDAAKLLALGATRVGFAMPALKAAMEGEGALEFWMEKIESELKVAMFCTNSESLSELNHTKVKT